MSRPSALLFASVLILAGCGAPATSTAARSSPSPRATRFKIPGGDGTHCEVCIDKMSFNSDGTIVPVKPTLQGLQTTVNP